MFTNLKSIFFYEVFEKKIYIYESVRKEVSISISKKRSTVKDI